MGGRRGVHHNTADASTSAGAPTESVVGAAATRRHKTPALARVATNLELPTRVRSVVGTRCEAREWRAPSPSELLPTELMDDELPLAVLAPLDAELRRCRSVGSGVQYPFVGAVLGAVQARGTPRRCGGIGGVVMFGSATSPHATANSGVPSTRGSAPAAAPSAPAAAPSAPAAAPSAPAPAPAPAPAAAAAGSPRFLAASAWSAGVASVSSAPRERSGRPLGVRAPHEYWDDRARWSIQQRIVESPPLGRRSKEKAGRRRGQLL